MGFLTSSVEIIVLLLIFIAMIAGLIVQTMRLSNEKIDNVKLTAINNSLKSSKGVDNLSNKNWEEAYSEQSKASIATIRQLNEEIDRLTPKKK